MASTHPEKPEREQEQHGLAIEHTTDHSITPSPPKSDLPIYTDEKSNGGAFSVNAKDVSTSSEKDMGIKQTASIEEEQEVHKPSRIRQFYKQYRIFIHLAAWLLLTAYVSHSRNSLPIAYRNRLLTLTAVGGLLASSFTVMILAG